MQRPEGDAGLTDAKRQPRVLTASGLTKVYQTGDVEIHALRGVDLVLDGSELIVLLGPSGSGKSTLLNILGGLDSPTEGSVHFREVELTGLDEAGLTRYRRNHVGFVFQFYNLIPSLTAAENVALVTEISRDPMTPAEALSLVGLSNRLDHFPAQLSGGEQQRVAIARAIAKRSEIHTSLVALLEQPSLYDEVIMLLARRGFGIDAECLERDWRVAREANDSVLAAWTGIYGNPGEY